MHGQPNSVVPKFLFYSESGYFILKFLLDISEFFEENMITRRDFYRKTSTPTKKYAKCFTLYQPHNGLNGVVSSGYIWQYTNDSEIIS